MHVDILPFDLRDQDDPHDDAHPEGENSAKRQKTSEYEAYVSRESSFGQVNVVGPDSNKQVSQDIMKRYSLTHIDEAKLWSFDKREESSCKDLLTIWRQKDMCSSGVLSDMGKSARFSTWIRKLITED
ncbi:hypothetical protein Tco_0454794 [Tanacetum coccineum]